MSAEVYASQNADKIHTDVLANAREACYKARDAFYACLENNSTKTASESASVGLLYPSECKKSRALFENNCRPAWVKHFDRQYCAKKRAWRFLDDNETRRALQKEEAARIQQTLLLSFSNAKLCKFQCSSQTASLDGR